MMRVLIAETNHDVARERAEQLCMDGHQAAVALTAQAAGLRLAELPDVLVLCELENPVQTITLLRSLRAGEIPRSDSRVAVLLVGADSDEEGVRYYQAGADITLPRASSPLLIAAALDALGRGATGGQRPRLMRAGRLTVDCDARTAHVADRLVGLTRLEFDLLQTLATQPGKAFTRAELTKEVWGYDPDAAPRSRTIDATAHRLRKKLDEAGAEAAFHNVRGIGWRLIT
jgi:DNA-binding response OmpR family regulator